MYPVVTGSEDSAAGRGPRVWMAPPAQVSWGTDKRTWVFVKGEVDFTGGLGLLQGGCGREEGRGSRPCATRKNRG